MPPNNPPNANASLKPKSDQFSQLVERLKSANNVLVTVSDSPSVDQLSACIGLTIALNKHGKHATAVFSGKVPSTLEFLQPERTIETNTDSLRDFIISLDKSKADKLKYKVEDDYVKIFITPYRTSISQDDLGFSQGDFNVDLIIMLGVHERQHLDGAIVSHGRILHDATVASMNTDTVSEIGTINWVESEASSLCEMASDLITEVDKSLLDSQIATALLTGMVAETDRFGNEKAHPHTMSVSGVLMAAGASPQLISSKLEEAKPESDAPGDEIPEVSEGEDGAESNDGTLKIDHNGAEEVPPEQTNVEDEPKDDIKIDEHGKLLKVEDLHEGNQKLDDEAGTSKIISEPPRLSGQLTANTIAEHDQPSPSTDPLSVTSKPPLLKRDDPHTKAPPVTPITPPQMPSDDQTLADIEKSVDSPHLQAEQADPVPPVPVDDARSAVDQAVSADTSYRPEPLKSVGANPVNLDLGHGNGTQSPSEQKDEPPQNGTPPDSQPPSSPPPVPPPFNPLGQ